MKARKLTDQEKELRAEKKWKAERVTFRKRFLELKALRDGIKERVAAKKREKRARSGATMGLIAINPERRGEVA